MGDVGATNEEWPSLSQRDPLGALLGVAPRRALCSCAHD